MGVWRIMTKEQKAGFVQRCISDTTEGLRKGLNHFSGKSGAAVIYAIEKDDPLQIYDPEGLLKGHQPRIEDYFFEDDEWRSYAGQVKSEDQYNNLHFDREFRLDGLFACGGSSPTVFYQMWFTNRPPDICSPLPFVSWLTYAAIRFSHDVANAEHLYTGVSGQFLKEYSTYAIHDSITAQLGKTATDQNSFTLDLHSILDTILGISRTHEEGHLPYGELVFTHCRKIPDNSFCTKFDPEELPQITSFKHVRKLLQAAEKNEYRLIANGHSIIGISNHKIPEPYIEVDYQGKTGFLYYNNNLLCSFADGKFFSTTHQAKLVELEEILLDSNLDETTSDHIFSSVSNLVHSAQRNNYGCAIIVDLSDQPLTISGQSLETPLDLSLPGHIALTKNLSKVDGAIHISKEHKLLGFACLLDGLTIIGEDRSRGARYNSALRFSSVYQDAVILVVSSDRRPVATIYRGMELTSVCNLPLVNKDIFQVKSLQEWLGS